MKEIEYNYLDLIVRIASEATIQSATFKSMASSLNENYSGYVLQNHDIFTREFNVFFKLFPYLHRKRRVREN